MSNNNKIPAVSVICITYNQEKFIRQTLEGFAIQKTDFPVEFIVHDDASTDGTADIIREYATRYPERFVLVLEEENQFAKGQQFVVDLIKSSRGKYLAFCEGDDYWTDPMKLQKQYDALQAHPDCCFCVHKTRGVSEDEKSVVQFFPKNDTATGVIEAEEVVRRLIGNSEWLFHTTSFFFEKELLLDGYSKGYTFVVNPMYGDQSMLLMGCVWGKYYYIDECMSVYRMNVKSGMMVASRQLEVRKQVNLRGIRALRSFDDVTKGQYHTSVEKYINFQLFEIAETDKNYRYMLRKENREYWMTIPVYKRLSIRIFSIFPFLDKLYYSLRKALKGI